MPRFVLEGEWTGYTSAQQRVVHREVVDKRFAERAVSLHAIVYTDGTSLLIRVRQAKPRERVNSINSYRELVREAVRYSAANGGKSRVLVTELPS